MRPSFRAHDAPAAGVRNTLLGQTLAHPVWMRPGFFVSGPHSKEFPVLDDLLDLFRRDVRQRRAKHAASTPQREMPLNLPFVDADEERNRRTLGGYETVRRPPSDRTAPGNDWS